MPDIKVETIVPASASVKFSPDVQIIDVRSAQRTSDQSSLIKDEELT